MKSFLHYAQTGELDHRHETGKEADSPFEEAVSDAIRHLGYDIEPQVGSAGFYIDIAVRDPEKPGRYILAVECDGASYHSSATAPRPRPFAPKRARGIGLALPSHLEYRLVPGPP